MSGVPVQWMYWRVVYLYSGCTGEWCTCTVDVLVSGGEGCTASLLLRVRYTGDKPKPSQQKSSSHRLNQCCGSGYVWILFYFDTPDPFHETDPDTDPGSKKSTKILEN